MMYTLIRENVERIVDSVDKAEALLKEGFRYVDKKEAVEKDIKSDNAEKENMRSDKKSGKKVADNNDDK
ncbi:MAG: hypothetical protein IJ583_13395 [Firmicutes bacterium]|nr:hypothetical protein [Bacillota bacterium]